MRDDVTYKTVPLPIAKESSKYETDEEYEARMQAQCDRVHPMVDAIREEEASVRRRVGDSTERALINNARRKRQRTLARKRAAEIEEKKSK